ncbi:Rv2231c family pyridoxal phosphate-dependent protein CobC [Actinokineospora sp. PR83]|uniref:Rv2231c family pyridoxal phosphate-dependent protein CobC n=1 Tax=Actinokineospora sp. PR83 TaxID=2884908 RepID=UPI0027E0C658|nr:Rv2231c family pyridoxal phosphate-dependent protein CobC [Actinokineospora sp. PR83]MCG8919938.1 Rv2231c family pyridoxal phosphate-dependent protein CobC [Actinokineospora sp. PR83]
MDGTGGLRHHGDVDAEPGLLDFAVNVRGSGPPGWLRARLVGALDRIGTYPSAADDRAARLAVADRHGRTAEEVVVLNGSAEGFALLPNLRPRLAALVHPSFTEPEVALRDAGVPVHHVLLDPADGYALHPERVPEAADLVVVGNPTNPTSTLHPARTLASLARPGRVLLVDEAFMDAVPGEPETLTGDPGVLVFRSLTKTWALPGLRAGYALGPPGLLARLTHGRPQWPVGTLVLEAVAACSEPHAVAEAQRDAAVAAAHRRQLERALREIPGITVHGPAAGPFLLLTVPVGLRAALRAAGIAVRRGDTFPGLRPDHVRIAVRAPAECAPLLAAVRAHQEVLL